MNDAPDENPNAWTPQEEEGFPDRWPEPEWAEWTFEEKPKARANGKSHGRAEEEEIFVGPKSVNFSNSLHMPIEPREWLDGHRLLRKNTAFQLNGDGGIGKTEIALQMMIGMCATGELFNLPVERGPCLFVSFEEPLNEIRWRIDHLCRAYGIQSSDVKNLHILDLTGERDPWMFKEQRDKQLKPTNRWTWLLKEFELLKPQFIVMDNKSRFFGANQNDAVLATSYAHHLELTCRDLDTTIMPLAHVSLSQLSTGRGDSGSVAAGNAFRSRLLFGHGDKDRQPDDPDGGERKLTVMKANASPTGLSLDFKWHLGLEYMECLYRPPSASDGIGEIDRHERVFMKLLKILTDEKIDVSNNNLSKRYAPKVFSARTERERCHFKGLLAAMQNLLKKGVIEVAEKGSGTRTSTYLREVKK